MIKIVYLLDESALAIFQSVDEVAFKVSGTEDDPSMAIELVVLELALVQCLSRCVEPESIAVCKLGFRVDLTVVGVALLLEQVLIFSDAFHDRLHVLGLVSSQSLVLVLTTML